MAGLVAHRERLARHTTDGDARPRRRPRRQRRAPDPRVPGVGRDARAGPAHRCRGAAARTGRPRARAEPASARAGLRLRVLTKEPSVEDERAPYDPMPYGP